MRALLQGMGVAWMFHELFHGWHLVNAHQRSYRRIDVDTESSEILAILKRRFLIVRIFLLFFSRDSGNKRIHPPLCFSPLVTVTSQEFATDSFEEIEPADDGGWTGRKPFETDGCRCWRIRLLEESGRFFRPFALRWRELPSLRGHPDSKFVLSPRVLSRYVFPPKDDVPGPTDCRKGPLSGGGRGKGRVKTERMEKSVKRPREKRGVLGVRNRILAGVASGRRWREPGRNQKGWNEIKGKWNILCARIYRQK